MNTAYLLFGKGEEEMAAIREWFAAYGIIYKHMEERHGPQALEEYWQTMGESLAGILGNKTGTEALRELREYFTENTPKDGGACEASLADHMLTVKIERCPDHLYFAETPYPTHKFGREYCRHCPGIYGSLAQACGCSMEHTPPQVDGDGAYHCEFQFQVKGEER